MRLSKLFKLSFVGTLIFSPGMAQQAENVHDQALKVLREADANQPGATQPSTTPAAPAARATESRSEREARLKAQAQQAMQERERAQAEKRRQFEEYVKERERLRQQKAGVDTGIPVHDKALEVLRQNQQPPAAQVTAAPVSPAPVAPPTATPAPAAVAPAAPVTPSPAAQPAPAATQRSSEDVQQRALEILRQQQSQTAAPARVTEAEVAPRVVAPSSQPPQQMRATPSGDNSDVHQKALEVLRQQQGQQAPSSASGSSLAPSNNRSASPAVQEDLKPSPELQRRLDEMQRELETEQRRSSAPPPVDEAYTRDLEERARQMMQQRSTAPTATAATATPAAPQQTAPVAATPAPRLDAGTSEIIRRQNQQLSSQGNAATSVRSTQPTLDQGAEARAREILRQQQQATASTASSTPAAQPAPQASSPAPVTTSSSSSGYPTSGADAQYSKELEDRARQILLQRQGQQQMTTSQAPTSPAASPQEAAAAAAAAAEVSRAPITTDPELSRVHSRALETLVQVEPGEDGQARLKSKQERLRVLTDLYRADRMTPAEYHQRRAQILAEDK